MYKCFDNLFDQGMILRTYREAISLSWDYNVMSNDPLKDIPGESTLANYDAIKSRFFGCRLYQHIEGYKTTANCPEIFWQILTTFVGGVLKESESTLQLRYVHANLQVMGQDGETHRDIIMNEGRDRSILYFPHTEWREEWGGQLQILDDDDNVIDEFLPLPGRIVYLDGRHPHRALAPLVPNLGRISIAYKLDTMVPTPFKV